ncbi:FRG1-like family-domain-containing protein [Sphaerosporella brunnea]|uniref:FRG1-like family-domain-containing protein n=1 Tax=Sphaerosporella brunnea TaxID=1250544 RepID=A0A5J5F9S0_9PEZI|nr:FRG1-like family-domain-containing protein [Sphaerosporella brunnea]
MVSALRFKGDKKPKKRKRAAADTAADDDNAGEGSSNSTKKSKQESPQEGEEAEGWVDSEVIEDLTGPLLLCIATTPPTCLAADAAGTVFASRLSDISGEDLSTASPTAVQQVWACARVHGSNTTPTFTLRSYTGRYLSVSKTGELSALREAIGAEEQFTPVRSPLGAGRWSWMGCRDTFLGVSVGGPKIAVRGDRHEVGFTETWTVRLQRRNKVRVKAGGGGAAGAGGAEDKGRVKDKITRRELEEMAGFALSEDQVKMLKKARREGGFHEALLDLRVKHGKHDKFAY